MSIDIKLPELGDGIDTADVLEVLVSEGDTIDKDQGIIELETDKATAVVPATHGGKVVKIHVNEGDTIPVGTLLLTLDAVAEDSPVAPAAPETPAPAAEQPRKEPEPVAPAQVESNQPTASPEPPAQESPPPKPQPPKPQPVAQSSRATVPSHRTSTTDPAEFAAGPAMRRFARELGVDLAVVTGTGESGRITREDILKVVRAGGAKAAVGAGTRDEHGPVRIEKLSRMRRTIAEQMHRSWSTVPRVTNFDDADVTDLENIRKSSKADYAARGIKLTSMPFVIKAVAMALREHPVINASVDVEAAQVTYKEYINIGIAVDTERGLVVPSLRGVDDLSIPEIAKKLGEIAEQVRNNQFTIDDLKGSTFTISNLGAIGGTYSTPIINVPETAILLIGRSRKMPVVVDDHIVSRLMMPLSISYDHRLIDGAAAARFLNDVIGYLEAPSRLLLAP